MFSPKVLDKLQTCPSVIGCDGNNPFQGVNHQAVGHLLHRHVGRFQLGHARVVGVGLRYFVEKGQHLCAVAACAFVFLHHLSHDRQFRFVVRLRADEHFVAQLCGLRLIVFGAIIVVERCLCKAVIGVVGQYVGKNLMRGGLLLVLHKPVSEHQPIVHVIGMVVA